MARSNKQKSEILELAKQHSDKTITEFYNFLVVEGYDVCLTSLYNWVRDYDLEFDIKEYSNFENFVIGKDKNGKKLYNKEKIERYIITLKAKGLTITEISNKLDVPIPTIKRFLYSKPKKGKPRIEKVKAKKSMLIEKTLTKTISSLYKNIKEQVDNDDVFLKLKNDIVNVLREQFENLKESGYTLEDLTAFQKIVNNFALMEINANKQSISNVLKNLGISKNDINVNSNTIQVSDDKNNVVINDFINGVISDD